MGMEDFLWNTIKDLNKSVPLKADEDWLNVSPKVWGGQVPLDPPNKNIPNEGILFVLWMTLQIDFFALCEQDFIDYLFSWK